MTVKNNKKTKKLNKDTIKKKKDLTKKDLYKIYKKYKDYKFGIGLEHETQFFLLKNPKIFLNNNNDNKNYNDNEIPILNHFIIAPTKMFYEEYLSIDKIKKIYQNNKITDQTANVLYNFFKNIPYEPTGRICDGKVVLSPLPGYKNDYENMPEFVTDRTIVDFIEKYKKGKKIKDKLNILGTFNFQINQLFFREYLFKNIMRKRFGDLTNFTYDIKRFNYGMSSHLKLIKDIKNNKLLLREDSYQDYLGSFHITITLPYKQNISLEEFIYKHENFANMVQWIEPLLMTAYFSGDDQSIGSSKKKIKGSFRVGRIGWGNFAGSDVRKFNSGIGRYAVAKPLWRKGLKFDGSDKVNLCNKLSESLKKKEPGAVSGFSSDFRTFGSRDPERPWHRESGIGMTIGNGVELRIFDNIPLRHMRSLCRIISYIVENSYKLKLNDYVYDNKGWIDAMHGIMLNGWLYNIKKSYLNDLRKNLGLKIKVNNLNSYHVFQTIVNELHNKYYKSDSALLLNGNILLQNYLNIPKINKESLEIGLSIKLLNNNKLLNNLNLFLKSLDNNHDKKININKLSLKFFKYFSYQRWKNDLIYILYYLESLKKIKLSINNKNEIISLKNLNNSISIQDINKYLFYLIIDQDEIIEKDIREILQTELYEGVGKYE